MGLPSLLRLGKPRQPPAIEARTEIHRQPMAFASDWQQAVLELYRRDRNLNPDFAQRLKAMDLLRRCVFLASDGAGPLLFRYIGEPTISFLGADWARAQLGKPDDQDPHQCLADGVGPQYREAIEGGQPILNRVEITGMSAAPKVYTHLLLGWRRPDGRRALLSCLDVF